MAGPLKAQRANVAERRAKAIQMRLAGDSYDTIANTLGYSDRAAAHKDITRALEASLAEQRAGAEVLREQELLRLDALWREVWQVLKTEHYILYQGATIQHGETVLLDDGPILQAVDRLLRIQERRAKFLGLDAPQRHEVTLDELDDQIRRLTAELGLPDPTQAGQVPDIEASTSDPS